MATYRVNDGKHFVITDVERGRREFTAGDIVTSADVYPFEKDHAGRDMTEIPDHTFPELAPDPEP